MQVVDIAHFQPNCDTAIALGYFDTFHLGHQTLLRAVVATPYTPCLFTFAGDFYGAVGENGRKPLYSPERRCSFAAEAGIRYMLTMDSNRDNMSLSCEDFFDLLIAARARALVCGQDFRFGKGAKGDVNTLADLCRLHNIELQVLPLVKDETGRKIGSIRLDHALQMGDIPMLTRALGRYYIVEGTVVCGRSVGHSMGVPTANILLDNRVQCPLFGVYACYVFVDGVRYVGVCSIGSHPTFGDDDPNVEAHLIDYDGALYGRDIQVALVAYLRPIRRFETASFLVSQIRADIAEAKQKIKEVEND